MFCTYFLLACSAVVLLLQGSDARSAGIEPATKGPPLKESMPWFHSSDELRSELQSVAASCRGAQVDITTRSKINSGDAAGQSVDLDVLRVHSPQGNSKFKMMLVFGEHARELVSPESALDIVRNLCGAGKFSDRAGDALEKADFLIVPNANPLGRRKVEEGYMCKRTNEDGVDLNRNWGDEHRNAARNNPGDEMNPGPNGFSEPETQILKDLVLEEKPDVYLSIHAGAYLLGAPWGYTADKPTDDHDALMELLRPISQQYCGGQCPYGGLAELIGYKSEGCDIDYVHEQLGTPYAFTWEIYVGSNIRENYIEEAKAREQGDSMNGGAQNFFNTNSLNLVQERAKGKSRLRAGSSSARISKLQRKIHDIEAQLEESQDIDNCNAQFNPTTADETRDVVQNWSGAYIDLCLGVAKQRAQKLGRAQAQDSVETSVDPGANF